MKKVNFFLSLMLFTLAFISCDKTDVPYYTIDDFSTNFGQVVSRSFIGQVVDVDNNPLQNVTVKTGAVSVQTDVNGVFIINNADVFEKFAYITAQKTGYLNGSRSMVPTSGKNSVKIMLVSNTPTQIIQSGSNSEVALPGGTKVNFDGAFEDENGNAYSGQITVSMFHLLPSDENLNSLMPGMLYAEREDKSEAVLQTFGMLNVELRGSGGQKLNLASGHTAQITMHLDASQLTNAPGSIPLWHFDEVGGYWKEDGIAIRNGNSYVGTVSHFSWWNCDMPNSSIRLTFTVNDSNGNPLSDVLINLVNSAGYHATGTTDSGGQLSGILPANQTFTLNIQVGFGNPGAGLCNGVIYTTTLGPYTSDTIVPTITLSPTTATSTEITGTLLKCDNTNVTNGYIILRYGTTETVAAVTNGTFSFNTLICSNNNQFTLEGIDFDNLQTSGVINNTFTPPTTNVGIINTCTAVTSFIIYQIDSNPPVFLPAPLHAGTTPPGVTGMQLYISSSNNTGFLLNGSTHVPGVYTSGEFNIYSTQFSIPNSNTIQYTLSNFGAIGEYVDMTANGTFTDASGAHILTCTIHVLRDY